MDPVGGFFCCLFVLVWVFFNAIWGAIPYNDVKSFVSCRYKRQSLTSDGLQQNFLFLFWSSLKEALQINMTAPNKYFIIMYGVHYLNQT